MPNTNYKSKSVHILQLSMLMFFGMGPVFAQPGATGSTSPGKALSGAAAENYVRLPLSFEKRNWGHGERFLARTQKYIIGLENGKATVQALSSKGAQAKPPVSIEFAGATSSHAVPSAELPRKVNYIRGNDPRKWLLGVPTYARIAYPEVYRGIDVVYYGTQQQIEFDLVVKPGSDPEAIRLKIGGAGELGIDGSGALTVGGRLRGSSHCGTANIPGSQRPKDDHCWPLRHRGPR